MKNIGLLLIVMLFVPICLAFADTTSLRYNWKPGITAKVHFKFLKSKSLNSVIQERKMEGIYILKTKIHKKGLQVDFSEVNTKFSANTNQEKDKFQMFIQKLSKITPSFIIDPKGDLIEVVGLEELKLQMQTEMHKWFEDSPPDEKQKVNQIFQRLLTEQQIMSQLQQNWNRDVGQWRNAEFEKGFVYSIDFVSPIPFLGNVQIPTKGEYKYLGRTNCNPSDQNQNCVILFYKSFLDQDATRKVITEMFKNMGIESPESFKLKIDYELQIITDPKTLLPRKIIETKIITAPSPGGTSLIIQTDKKEILYTYLN